MNQDRERMLNLNPQAEADTRSFHDHPIGRGLRRLRRRLFLRQSLRMLGAGTAVLALGLAVGAALDLSRAWNAGWRCGFWTIRVAAPCVFRMTLMMRRMRCSPSWLELAALAERSRPDLSERLIGAAALLLDRSHNSDFLTRRLVRQAAIDVATLDPGRIAPWGRAPRWASAGLAALALVIAPAIWRPDPFATALARAAAPWLRIERAGLSRVDVERGDQVVLAGEPIVIDAAVWSPLPVVAVSDQASLSWRDASGNVRRLVARSKPGLDVRRKFEFRLPALSRSIEYQIECGFAQSRTLRVTVAEPPAIVEWSAIVEPPAYTSLPGESFVKPTKVTAPEGSRVIVTGAANRPLRCLWIGDARSNPIFEATAPFGLSDADPRAWRMAFAPRAGGDYRISGSDEYGWPLRESPLLRIAIRPDAPPAIEWDGPEDGEALRPDDVLQADVTIRDDFAVMSAELVVQPRQGGDLKPETRISLPRLQGLRGREAIGEAALSLRRLGLKTGDSLIYRIRATDNRDLGQGPNIAVTEARTLKIDDRAEPNRRRSSQDPGRWKARLAELRRRAAASRSEAEPLRYAADAARSQPSAWTLAQSQGLRNQGTETQGIADALLAFGQEIHQSPFYAALADDARSTSTAVAEPIVQNLTSARQTSDSFARLDRLKQADSGFAALAKRLEDMEARLDRLAKLAEDRQRVRQLAERQEDLARSLRDQDRSVSEIRDDQDRIQREAAEFGGDDPKLQAARTAVDRARQTLNDPMAQAAQASQAMREAANGLRAAGSNGGGANSGASGGGDSGPTSGAMTAPLTSVLEPSGSSARRRWGELPGHLRAETSKMSQLPFREEYAPWIRRYYRALAETPER